MLLFSKTGSSIFHSAFQSRGTSLAVICITFLGVYAMLVSCVNDIEKIKAFSPSEILPVVQAENFETVFSDSGIVRFYLKTPELKRFEADGNPFIEFPKGIILIQYDRQMKVVSSITARYAKQFVKEQRWEAKNDVIATNSMGDTLRTEQLIWDEHANKIYSEEFVRIIRPNQNITGIGFESNQSLQNWKIRKPKGPIYVQLKQDGTPPDSLNDNLVPRQPVNIGNH
jgi:LPS export ABC transporter protein LptC